MRYADGSIVHIGDHVNVSDGIHGRVVCSIDTHEYSADYRKEDWSALGSGVLVMSDEISLVHYTSESAAFEKR